MDPEPAAPATSRRSLLGAVGAAGLAGAAALAVARPVSAAPEPQPYSPTPSDREILGQVLQLELAVQRLYFDAIEAGLDGDAAEVARVFGKNHEFYADQFAAITGISADTFDEAAYEANRAAFATSDVEEFAVAAWTVENNAAVTYRDLLTEVEAVEAQQSVAAIAVMNGRMATVLADLAGVSDDVDVLFDPPGEPITLGEGTASGAETAAAVAETTEGEDS